MDATTIRLKDNRRLSYAEYGNSDGVPVLLFHGRPGSRFLPVPEIEAAARSGIRLINPERPGYGWSDFQPDRTLLDWPDDVTALIDHLNIPKVGIIGPSAGGPYAAACAYKIPDRLTRVAIISSKAPYNAFGEPDDNPTLADAVTFANDIANQFHSNPEALVESIIVNLPNEGVDSIQSSFIKDWLLKCYEETLRNGTEGLIQELMLLHTLPWGFPLAEITADVQIWHGEQDTAVSIKEGEFLAQNIPNCQFHRIPDAGHFIPGIMEQVFQIFL